LDLLEALDALLYTGEKETVINYQGADKKLPKQKEIEAGSFIENSHWKRSKDMAKEKIIWANTAIKDFCDI
jgi:hypothetical protein